MRLETLPADGWAAAVADAWRERLATSAALRMCLPSGSTPAPVYALLEAGFARTEAFLLDEFGGLPPGHHGRSESMVRRDLLDHVDLPEPRFHVPDVDAADVDAACASFDARIADGGLDLAVLGLGTNGHLGMNEPGSAPDSPTRVVRLAPATREGTRRYGIDEPPTWGVTIGLGPLLAAREVWLLVAGARKRAILDRVLHGEMSTDCPASLLRDHPDAVVWANDTASG